MRDLGATDVKLVIDKKVDKQSTYSNTQTDRPTNLLMHLPTKQLLTTVTQ